MKRWIVVATLGSMLVYHRTVDPENYIGPRVEWTGFGSGGPLP